MRAKTDSERKIERARSRSNPRRTSPRDALRSADGAHGRPGCARLSGRLGNRRRRRSRRRITAGGVRVDLGLEDRLLQLDLLPHQPHAEDVRRDLAETDAHLCRMG